MATKQWKDKHYRKFRNRKAFIIQSIDQHIIDMKEIESIGPIYISNYKNRNDIIKMHCTIVMKSGNKIKIDKDLKGLFRKVTYTNLFGQKRIKRVPFNDYFKYYNKELKSDGAIFQEKLKEMKKDFYNNVCILRK